MSKTIFGAGTSNNPIKSQVACEQGYAALPYIIKNEETDNCKTTVTFENGYYYDYTSFTESCDCTYTDCGDKTKHKHTSGTFTVEGLEFHYDLDIVKNCNPKPECEGGCTVGDYWITKEDGELFVNYEQFSFSNCNSITKSIKKSGFACSTDSDITVSTDCGDKFTFRYECDDVNPCSASTVVNIRGVTFTPVTVEYSGGNVTITISYEKIITDADCNERKSRGSIILSGSVSACTSNCCYDKSVPLIIKKSDILGKLKLPNDTPITYNGKEVTGDYIIFNIVQKANPDPNECSKDCNYHITYCVLETDDHEHEIKVEYETYWGSKVWSGETIGPAGGRAKISFDYKAFAESTDASKSGTCKAYEFNGKDSVIIEVPPCDPDAEDPQPSYTLPGVILYKERYSGCSATTHVSGETVTIDGEDVFMNHISYEITQDCTGTCVPHEYKDYGKVDVINVDPCETSVNVDVPYTVWKVNDDCSRVSGETGTERRTVLIDMNQTNSAATYYPDDDITVIQNAGPCMSAVSCSCESALTIYDGGEYTDVCKPEEVIYEFEPVTITCNQHETVEIPFIGYCGGVAVYNGTYKWTGNFDCNTGEEPVYHTRSYSGDSVITVKQLGDPNCSCSEAPDPSKCESQQDYRIEYEPKSVDCRKKENKQYTWDNVSYSAYCKDNFIGSSVSSVTVTINADCNDRSYSIPLPRTAVTPQINMVISQEGGCKCYGDNEFKWKTNQTPIIIDALGDDRSVIIPEFISTVDGEETNATVTTEVTWITTSGVELEPFKIDNTLQIQQYASTEQYRLGEITLHQVGTTKTIKATIRQTGSAACIITEFWFAGENLETKTVDVRVGDDINYSMKCSENCGRQYLQLRRQETPVTSIDSQSTEPVNGWSYGTFHTSGKPAGHYKIEMIVNGEPEVHTANILSTFNVNLTVRNEHVTPEDYVVINKLKFEFTNGLYEEFDVGSVKINRNTEKDISLDFDYGWYSLTCRRLLIICESGTYLPEGWTQQVMVEGDYFAMIT